MGVLTKEIVTKLITAGLAAPSAENHHYVDFAWNGSETITLRWLPPDNIGAHAFNARILSLIGAGTMIENIVIRASHEGLGVEIEEKLASPWLILLHFQPISTLVADPLDTVIVARHTNRKWFRNPGLSATQKHEIEELRSPFSKTEHFFWLDQPPQRDAVLKLIWRAESERFKSAALHQELFSAVRFDLGWNATAEEGLPPGSLEVEKLMRPGFEMMSHWPLAKALSMLGAHRMMGLRAAYLPARGAPNLAVIATTQQLEPGCLAAGRLLERIWLKVTEYGLSMQPLVASCLLSLPGWHGVSPTCALKLEQGWNKLIGPEILPVVLFRIGTADPVTVRTSRKPVTSIRIDGLL